MIAAAAERGDGMNFKRGHWEGPVDVYSPHGTVQSYQTDVLSNAKIDLEKLIFGKA
jgi:hypothetical protein